MSPVLTRKLKLLGLICAFSACAGMFYQRVGEETIGIESLLIGVPVGLIFGVMELFAFEAFGRRLRSLSFIPLVATKAVLYTLFVFVIVNAVGLYVGLSEGKTLTEFAQSLVDPDNWTLILFCLAFYVILAFFVQMSRMVGQDVLMKFLRGRYMRPTEEDRVFMFLDLRDSTPIAEKLGPTYYRLLDDFFHDISHPVMMTRAEIYQYVGDEVVLTWDLDVGVRDANCLRVFTLINEAVAARADEYRRKYGVTGVQGGAALWLGDQRANRGHQA